MALPFSFQRSPLAALLLLLLCTVISSQKFEPYQLNGGLVSAVAGKNYCLLAADTRMMDGGYQIYTRNLMRLWGIDGYDNTIKLPETMDEELTCNISTSTLIAAAGCASDCDALQRQLTFQMRAHGDAIPTRSVAQLLSQTLYSRRTFPYYSFCVVGGLLTEDDDDCEGGTVYVYDAIGSMEQVAVATAGTGRELLQPILDRLFSAPGTNQVDCSPEEAMDRVVEAYHAVAERDIGVGDSVVLCLMEPSEGESDTPVKCRIVRVALKKH